MTLASQAQNAEDKLLFAIDPVAMVHRDDGNIGLRMPNGLSSRQLRAIGRRGSDALLERLGLRPICLVGVASRGLPIAVSVALTFPHDRVAVSLVKDEWVDDKVESYRHDYLFVIVDNTIKS